MSYLFVNSICGFVYESFFILSLQIYIDIFQKIAFLEFNDLIIVEHAF